MGEKGKDYVKKGRGRAIKCFPAIRSNTWVLESGSGSLLIGGGGGGGTQGGPLRTQKKKDQNAKIQLPTS